MNRCVPIPASPARRRLALAALVAGAVAAFASSADAQQVTRRFPISALRGRIAFTNPPDIALDGEPARLSPGVRIHGLDNMMVVTGAVAGDGRRYDVDYRLEATGLVSEVWLLTPQEAAVKPWPRTPAEAAAWTFDYMAQTWTKP
jgi:hypothetical protein